MKYIRHITLTTGHARDSYRNEVNDSVVALCADLVRQIIAAPNTKLPMPHMPGYTISGEGIGRCLLATIYAGPTSLIQFGVAGHQRCGADLWRRLNEFGFLAGTLKPAEQQQGVLTGGTKGVYEIIDQQPRAPWCAAALDIGITQHVEHMAAFGDFERCLAWGFLEARQ